MLLVKNIPSSEPERKYGWNTVSKDCMLNLDQKDHANVSIIRPLTLDFFDSPPRRSCHNYQIDQLRGGSYIYQSVSKVH